MTYDPTSVYLDLEKLDIEILAAIERGMAKNEWVPKKQIPDLSGLPPEEARFRLQRTNKHELIEQRKTNYTGYRLTQNGYDQLAINALVKQDTIHKLGGVIEEGKESVIYICQNPTEKEIILKMHREGYTNFREITKQREYTADKHHVSWLYTARKAAEREHIIMQDLQGKVNTLEPISQNRHCIAMKKFNGAELGKTKIDKPELVHKRITDEMKNTYEAGYIHGDLSEYNVMISDTDLVLIDWPQAVETDHPNAEMLLDRDITNIHNYFKRKYPGFSFPKPTQTKKKITS